MSLNIPIKNIVAVKPKSSYPNNILKEFGLLSVDKNNSFPIGTFSYRYSRFPSDIDTYEQVKKCCSIDDAINFFIRSLKRIVNNIITQPLHYFMEVKLGLDERFKLNNYYKLIDHKLIIDPILYNKVLELYQQSLLTKDEFDQLLEIINKTGGQLEYEILDELLRKHYIVRWTAQDILQGFKILPKSKILSMRDALRQKTPTNIEIINYLDGRFIDESNFYVLGAQLPDGNIIMINFPQEYITEFPDFFIEGLKKSIEKLYYSKINANPFKMLKRFWSLAKYLKDKNMIRILYPFLSSDVAAVNQLKSDFGTLAKLFKKVNHIPYNLVVNELSNMKDRISNILLFDNDTVTKLNDSLDELIKIIQFPVKNNTDIIKELNSFEDILFDFVEKQTITFLQQNNLSPPPSNYLPANLIFS